MFILAEIGRITAQLRRAQDLSQLQAALNAHVSLSRWQQIEHGCRNATIDTLRRMAEALGVPPLVLGILSWSDSEILSALRHLPQAKPFQTGQNIALLRKTQGLSQRALAQRAHVSVSRLRDLEHGCANVTISLLARIAKGLGISLLALCALGLSGAQVLDMVHRARAAAQMKAP